MKNPTQKLINEFNKNPWKGVIAVTGGGTGVIDALLKNGGGSNTLLEAVVPYSEKSFDKYVKGKPESYCSELAARQLAMASWLRAIDLSGRGCYDRIDIFGLGVTASLAKNGPEREGRKHSIHIAIQTSTLTRVATYHLCGNNRKHEETICVELILDSLFRFMKKGTDVLDKYQNYCRLGDCSFEEDKMGHISNVLDPLFGKYCSSLVNPSLVFPGSFNPLHDGHKKMIKIAEYVTGCRLYRELSITNVDKLPLDFIEIKKRTDQFGVNERYIITDAPKFADKVHCLGRNITFVVGYDTWYRILNDPNAQKDFETFSVMGTKFIIFGRTIDGVWNDPRAITNGHKFEYLSGYDNLTFIPKYLFCDEISSTQIRNAK